MLTRPVDVTLPLEKMAQADIYIGQSVYDSFSKGDIIEKYAKLGVRISLCTWLYPDWVVGVTEKGRREVKDWEKQLKERTNG